VYSNINPLTFRDIEEDMTMRTEAAGHAFSRALGIQGKLHGRALNVASHWQQIKNFNFFKTPPNDFMLSSMGRNLPIRAWKMHLKRFCFSKPRTPFMPLLVPQHSVMPKTLCTLLFSTLYPPTPVIFERPAMVWAKSGHLVLRFTIFTVHFKDVF
jgi:hypothetical protein